MKLQCEACQKEFEHRKRKKYCSNTCDPTRNKECVACAVSFVDDTRTNQQRYCGDECNPAARKSRDKVCGYCQLKFVDKSKQNSMSFCNEECRRKSKILRKAARDGTDAPIFLNEQRWKCVYCAKVYIPRDASQMYCDTDCRAEAYREVQYEDVPTEYSRSVQCLECNESFYGCIPHGGRSGNHFETKHNMTTQEYQAKHLGAPIYCEASVWKQKQKTWEATPEQRENYSKGLLRYYSQNDVWNKNLSPKDHPSVQQQSETMTQLAKAEGYVNGFKGKKPKEGMKTSMSELQKELQSDFVYRKNWMESRELAAKLGMHLSEPHAVLIQAMKNSGLWDQYQFDYEVWLHISGIRHGIDIATNRPFKLAIEVDGCYYHGCPDHCKLHNLKPELQERIQTQIDKDAQLNLAYAAEGWRYLRFWEHDLKGGLASCVHKIAEVFGLTLKYTETYEEVAMTLDVELKALMVRGTSFNLEGSESISQIFEYYRTKGFPYHRTSTSRIKTDFEMLCKYDPTGMETEEPNEIVQRRKGLGMKAPNYFMRNFYEARRYGGKSMLEVFNDDERLVKVIESRKKHARKGLVSDATMRTGLRIAAAAPSSFPAAVAKYVYKRYLPTTQGKHPFRILDPCAGFGGRMIGSQALTFPIEYVGFDPWTENVGNLETMREWLGFKTCSLNNLPFEEAELEPEKFDLAFTSPPHFDKEIYTEESTQSVSKFPKYEDWVKGFLDPMILKVYEALKPGSYFVLHVSEMEVAFVRDSREGMQRAGFVLEPDLLWKQQTFLSGNKEPRYEPFIVGKKPENLTSKD